MNNKQPINVLSLFDGMSCGMLAFQRAGKTVIVNRLKEKYKFRVIQSYTTRPKRSDNEKGHIFVSDDEFNKLIDIVAYTEFCGYLYCATAEQVDNNDLYIIDPNGVEYFRNHYCGKKQIKIICIDCNVDIRYKRMIKRARKNGKLHCEATEEAFARMRNDAFVFYHYEHGLAHKDVIIKNNLELETAVDKIYDFICACENKKNKVNNNAILPCLRRADGRKGR